MWFNFIISSIKNPLKMLKNASKIAFGIKNVIPKNIFGHWGDIASLDPLESADTMSYN